MSDETKELKPLELPGSLSVRDLAEAMEASPIEVIKTLMANGVMANINQTIDFDAAAVVASEMGFEANLETVDQLEAEDEGEIPLWPIGCAKSPPRSLIHPEFLAGALPPPLPKRTRWRRPIHDPRSHPSRRRPPNEDQWPRKLGFRKVLLVFDERSALPAF